MPTTHRSRPPRILTATFGLALTLAFTPAFLATPTGAIPEGGAPEVALLDGSATEPAAAPARPPLPDVGTGTLLACLDGAWLALPAQDVRVELSVTGMIVRGVVEQEFANPYDTTLDAVYAFPLPERAAVHAMELAIGDRTIRSEVQERAEARRTFEQARASGRKAALVEQQRPNLFTTAAANLMPGDRVVVRLEYLEELAWDGDAFRLRFPLTFTTRFDPGGPFEPEAGGFAARPSTPRARISVALRAGVEPAELRSTSHEIAVERGGEADGVLRVVTAPGRVPADRDFRLEWAPAAGDTPRAAAFVEERDGERYAMVLLVPPDPGSDAGEGLPTETIFVVDVSGSMAGPSIARAREALDAALARLRPDDRFNILRFNDGRAFFSPEALYAGPAAVERARAWVRGLEAGGGTAILPALMAAVQAIGDARSAHVPRIVFLTDGAVANEDEVLRTVVETLGDTRLHALAIGHAPNAYLIRKLSELGHGHHAFVADPETLGERLDAFLTRLERPVWSDLRLDWEGAEPWSVFPSRLPDLHAGAPLYVSARLDDASSRVTLAGRSRAGALELDVDLREAGTPAGSGVAIRWARAQVEDLMDGLHRGVAPEEIRDEVVGVALRFGLVTRYTSLVAVDDRPTAPELAARRMVGILPQGGTDGPVPLALGALLLLAGLALATVELRLR